jgi:hypothetical protein
MKAVGTAGGSGRAEAYEFVIPLDGHGRLDTWMWHEERGACTVKRIDAGRLQRIGMLTQRHDGMWAFSYGLSDADDEVLPKFNAQPFVVGRSVAVVDTDNRSCGYEIVEVGPAIVLE